MNKGKHRRKDKLTCNLPGPVHSQHPDASCRSNSCYIRRGMYRDSLSSRILKAVYHPNEGILEASLGNHPSQIWRAVIEGRDMLKQGLIKRIGNGQNTDIWNCNWIPRPENMRPIVSLVQNPPQLVGELLDVSNTRWNTGLIE